MHVIVFLSFLGPLRKTKGNAGPVVSDYYWSFSIRSSYVGQSDASSLHSYLPTSSAKGKSETPMHCLFSTTTTAAFPHEMPGRQAG